LLEQLVRSRIGVAGDRRAGLWAGVDLERPELAPDVVAACQRRGVLVGSMLHAEGTIRISPPLVIGDEELRHGIHVLGEAIQEVISG